jgi:hypothetical protein
MAKRARAPRGEATEEDFFCTPPWAVEALRPFVPAGVRIWEPTFGAGAISRVFEDAGHVVVKSDKFPKEAFPCEMIDFLTQTPAEAQYDWIIFNPPFSQMGDFLKRACDLGRPFAMLCPLYTFETPLRFALIRDHQLSVLILNKRCNFRKANGEEKRGTPFLSVWLIKHPDHRSKILFQ